MKICVCSFYDNTIKEYGDLSRSINSLFCVKNNFDYIVKHKRTLKNRHPAWERIPLIIELLNKNYDYIIYIDSDAYFRTENDSGNKLKKIIEKYESDHHLILSKDLSQIINTGFMIIKNCSFNKNLFWKLLIGSEYKAYYNKRTWEQDAFIALYNTNVINAKKYTKLLDYGILQSFKKDENLNSLIVHYEQTETDERIKWLTDDLNEMGAFDSFESISFV